MYQKFIFRCTSGRSNMIRQAANAELEGLSEAAVHIFNIIVLIGHDLTAHYTLCVSLGFYQLTQLLLDILGILYILYLEVMKAPVGGGNSDGAQVEELLEEGARKLQVHYTVQAHFVLHGLKQAGLHEKTLLIKAVFGKGPGKPE